MPRRPLALTLALAGTTSTLAALWPSQAQLADLRLRAAETPEEHLKALEARRALSPHAPGWVVKLAEGYAQAGRTDAALALLDKEAARRALDRGELALGRRLALAAGQPGRALGFYLTPHAKILTGELTSLVDLALMAGDLETARRLQARLVAARPHDAAALMRARDLAVMGHDLPAALQVQAALLKAVPGPEAASRLASLKLQAGDPLGALDTLEAHPPAGDRASWHHRAAQLAEWGRRPDRALPHLQALYDARPQSAMGHRVLMALELTDGPAAAAFAPRLAAAHPDDDGLQRAVLASLAKAGQRHAALAIATRRVERRPDDRAAHDALVDFSLGQKWHDPAIAELGRWVARQPKDMVSLHRLAEVLTWRGRTGEAWDVYERLFATTHPPRALELAWRRAWLGISTPTDDRTPAGRDNLARLAVLDATYLPWQRRLAFARWAAGDRAGAIAAQRRLADHPDATPDDTAHLGHWLLAEGAIEEGLGLLARHDRRAPLPAPALADAAYRAAGADRWQAAGYFFGRLASAQPLDPGHWTELATALERSGDLKGAAAAIGRRLALGEAEPGTAGRYMYLLRRAGRDREALAYFATAPLETLDARALAEAADLAHAVGDAPQEERARRAMLFRRPIDAAGRLRLAELLDARGARAEADMMVEAALALAPRQPEVLYRAAARRVYGGRAATAGPLIERLAALETAEPRVLNLLADYFESREPARAAKALDTLHQQGGGTAAGWLRRGELAMRMRDADQAALAWQRALELAGPADGEVRARVLERLERPDEALAAWEALLASSPSHRTAAVAIARHHLRRGDMAAAGRAAETAMALGPDTVESRLVYADWLEASGRTAEALPLVAALRAQRPGVTLTMSEARLRQKLGQRRAARALAREAVAAAPTLAPETQSLRHLDGPKAFFRTEHTGLLDRQEWGVAGTWAAHDAVDVGVTLRDQHWSGLSPTQEVTAEARQRLGSLRFDGSVGLVRQDGQVQSPLATAGTRWVTASTEVSLRVEEARWTDAPETVQQAGRDRRVAADVTWQPTPAMAFQAGGGVGRLALGGLDVGLSTAAAAQALLRPVSTWPLTLAYQFAHRSWDAAGPAVGLPTAIQLHGLLARYEATLGPLTLALAPGYTLDAASATSAPTLAGTLSFHPHPDAALTLDAGFAGRSFTQGLADTYHRLELTGHWYF